MLCLYIQAPFAAFRTFTAGSMRPTAPFITPSAAYGLLLNLAGIDMRHDDGKSPMTLIRSGLPSLEIAIGALVFPQSQMIYQQLHNYPVGNSGKEREADAKGSKYNIVPARRAFLSGLKAYVAMRGDEAIEQQVLAGLAGEGPVRYGLPFLGDNAFLPDRLEPVAAPEPSYWFVPVDPDDAGGMPKGVARLTLTIDRQDMSRTRSQLYQPTPVPQASIPDAAWTAVAYG